MGRDRRNEEEQMLMIAAPLTNLQCILVDLVVTDIVFSLQQKEKNYT